MREIVITSQFRKDLKSIRKRGFDTEALDEVLEMLANDKERPQQFRDHGLSGKYLGLRECHIKPDWLLIYSKSEDKLLLILSRTGTHSDLF